MVSVTSLSIKLATSGEKFSNKSASMFDPKSGSNGRSYFLVDNRFRIERITALLSKLKATSPVTGFLVKVKSMSEYILVKVVIFYL
jgi:hypothetical protein